MRVKRGLLLLFILSLLLNIAAFADDELQPATPYQLTKGIHLLEVGSANKLQVGPDRKAKVFTGTVVILQDQDCPSWTYKVEIRDADNQLIGTGYVGKQVLRDNTRRIVAQTPEADAQRIAAVPTAQDINNQMDCPRCAERAAEEEARPREHSDEAHMNNRSHYCTPTAQHRICQERRVGCDQSNMPPERRRKLLPLVIQAVNEINQRPETDIPVHPAMILALIERETKGNPLAINGEGDGGFGLGQFTVNPNASRAERANAIAAIRNLGIEYPENGMGSKPSSEEEAWNLTEPIGTNRHGYPVYSVWSAKGSVIAIATKLGRLLNRSEPIGENFRDVKAAFTRNLAVQTRMVATYFNRGNKFFHSCDQFRRRYGTLPTEFGQIWEARRIKRGEDPNNPNYETPAYPRYEILFPECKARCHVEAIAGLCGDEAQGYLAYNLRYLQENARLDGTVWTLAR